MSAESTTLGPRIDDLCLGAVTPKKVMHHGGCPHARRDYGWARRMGSIEHLLWELWDSGAWRWHRCCQSCCGDIDDAFYALTRRRFDD